MKELILLPFMLIIIGVFTSAHSQTNKYSIGLEGGVGISNTNRLLKPGIGYKVGIVFQYQINNNFAINTGLGYENRSSKDDSEGVQSEHPISFKMEQNYNFITLPILFQARIGSKVKFFINTGPYFSYLLKLSGKYTDEIANTTTNTDYTDNIKKFEAGISIGIGGIIPISDNMAISLEIRNNTGLTNLSESEGATDKTNSTLLLMGVNYRF